MEADKGIRIQLMSTRGMVTIHYRDRRIGMLEQGIGERHSGSTGTDNEIIRFEFLVDHWRHSSYGA